MTTQLLLLQFQELLSNDMCNGYIADCCSHGYAAESSKILVVMAIVICVGD